jgi:hypothetical protein
MPLGEWAKLGATQQAILDAIEAGTTAEELMGQSTEYAGACRWFVSLAAK